MRYSLIFFLVPLAVSAQRSNTPVPVAPQNGDLCCSDHGVADSTGTCAAAGLNSYCCSDFQNWTGNGCDGTGINGFPTGRTVTAHPPGPNDGSACGTLGFIGCA
ncbi:uncharacterized protein GLRG_00366, partial [Colletotrichum graminicola M1.001]